MTGIHESIMGRAPRLRASLGLRGSKNHEIEKNASEFFESRRGQSRFRKNRYLEAAAGAPRWGASFCKNEAEGFEKSLSSNPPRMRW
jgi:hypothetical protein